MKKLIIGILFLSFILTGCDYSREEDRTGIFYHVFVQPIDQLIHALGHLFNEQYGLAIIIMVLLVRFILLPFMLIQTKNMHITREKTKVVQSELDQMHQKLKEAKTPEERQQANRALTETYSKYGISPWKGLVGCLPILIQIPIILGLVAALRYPSEGGIIEHPHFLWFNLMEPDLAITLIAAVMYFIQPLVNAMHYPKSQRGTYYFMMVASPIFISFASLHSTSALGLYWTFSGLFLIIQMHFAHSHYHKVAVKEAQQLRENHHIQLSDDEATSNS
ncbi:membrane protein insertase YidC [Staphylococcus auricularis]|uniref:Membrane protein insertase YidC n=1 Tax=Staphylococcus auricularis TaxID=29379 RepID=A0AAW7ME87_9STAP|nr:membrane protein insertase YidC [Staphylococcus auricularis]MDC6327692.1 membrane protein insertase YidC [Staphylococcus auricularis]MDN4533644.1 membrane protein insertase YidC [Staphylococcus auricularis]